MPHSADSFSNVASDTCRSLALTWHEDSLAAELEEISFLQSSLRYLDAGLELMHQLQRERGASSLYLGSAGGIHLEILQKHRQATDGKLASFINSLPYHARTDVAAPAKDPPAGGSSLMNKRVGFRQGANLALVLVKLSELRDRREEIDRCHTPKTMANICYTELLARILAFIFSTFDSLPPTEALHLYVALYYLAETKEFAGQERAWGSLGLSAGYFSQEEQSRLADLIERQEKGWQICLQLTPELVTPQMSVLEKVELPVEKMRRRLHLQASQKHPILPDSLEWFTVTTARIDALRELEICFLQKLADSCETARQVLLERQRAHLGNDDSGKITTPILPLHLKSAVSEKQAARLPVGVQSSLGAILAENARRLKEVEGELTATRQVLAERKHIDQAKGLLMKQHNMSEAEAYRTLRDEAMRRNCRMSELAVQFIETATLWNPANLPASRKT